MAKESRAFGTQRAAKTHLISTGGLSGEIGDLRNDVEEGFQNLEERAGYPELDYLQGGAVGTAGADRAFVGRTLLQSQTFDAITLSEGTAVLELEPVKPGDSGVEVEMVVGGSAAVAYDHNTKVLTLTVVTGGTTANAVATLVNADGAATDGYIKASATSGGSFTAAQDKAPMVGGVGDYDGNKIMVAGTECLPSNSAGISAPRRWQDSKVYVTIPSLSGVSSGDVAQATLASDGKRADALSFVVS
jgi:hypothetical protein